MLEKDRSKDKKEYSEAMRDEEAEEEFADELDDVVPPLQDEVSEHTLAQRRWTLHRRSTLCIDDEVVNFSAEIDKKTKAILNKCRGSFD